MYFLVFAFENTKKQLIFLCICQSDSLKVLRSSAMVTSILLVSPHLVLKLASLK